RSNFPISRRMSRPSTGRSAITVQRRPFAPILECGDALAAEFTPLTRSLHKITDPVTVRLSNSFVAFSALSTRYPRRNDARFGLKLALHLGLDSAQERLRGFLRPGS